MLEKTPAATPLLLLKQLRNPDTQAAIACAWKLSGTPVPQDIGRAVVPPRTTLLFQNSSSPKGIRCQQHTATVLAKLSDTGGDGMSSLLS